MLAFLARLQATDKTLPVDSGSISTVLFYLIFCYIIALLFFDCARQDKPIYTYNILLTLLPRNVIYALARGHKRHVPYRNSTLTRLLQDCLGDNGKTNFIVRRLLVLASLSSRLCSNEMMTLQESRRVVVLLMIVGNDDRLFFKELRVSLGWE